MNTYKNRKQHFYFFQLNNSCILSYYFFKINKLCTNNFDCVNYQFIGTTLEHLAI